MRVDITSRLKDNEDPVMVIGDVEITVKSDAPTVLQLMGIMGEEGDNIEKMRKAQDILFSKEDCQKVSKMPFYNWGDFMNWAVQLAIHGEIEGDEEETEESKEEGESPNPTTT